MAKRIHLPPDLKRQNERERRMDRALARKAVQAIHRADPVAFRAASEAFEADGHGEAWMFVFRALAREPPHLNATMRVEFFRVWTKSKSLRLRVGEDKTVIAVLRALLPPYNGPPLQLYRGTSANEWQERRYGMSWTVDREIAEGFARRPGYDVLLATLAPSSAIICAVEYEPPFTDEELEELAMRKGYPLSLVKKLQRHEFHEETEYLVDGNSLTEVEVVRRFQATARRT